MTTYYLDPNGDDGNSGSESDPWHSLSAASGTVSAGDTIVVRGGTYSYSSASVVRSPDGTASSPVTVRAADGADPVFDWGWSSGESGGWGATDRGSLRLYADHWTLDGLTLAHSPFMGLYAQANGVTVRNCVGRDNYLTGLHARAADSPRFENCVAHHNTASGGDSDGISFTNCSNGTVVNCVSHHNSDDGIDLWDSSGCVIDRCVAHSNGPAGDGNGFKMGSGASSNNTVQRSAAYANEYAGFHWNTAAETTFYNNTAYDNAVGFVAGGSGCAVTNNVAYRNGSAASVDGSERTNSWNLGISDPGFVSTDPSTDGFLHLASDSPCIDAGTDVGLQYNGSAPDLGFAEYASTDADQSSGTGLYYHDGSGWREVTMHYHDGSGFA